MVSRKKVREKAAAIKESVAGTVSETVSKATQKGQTNESGQDLENFRDEEITDQRRARLERAKARAEQEAEKEARQEFVEEYQEELKEEARKEKLAELQQQTGSSEQQQSGGPSLFGGANDDFQPQLPTAVAPAMGANTGEDQTEARIERAKREAQKEAQRSAREKFLDDVRDDVKDDVEETELERLKRKYGRTDPTQQQDQNEEQEPRGALGVLFGPRDDADADQTGPQVAGMVADDESGPQLPPFFDDSESGNSEPDLPFRF